MKLPTKYVPILTKLNDILVLVVLATIAHPAEAHSKPTKGIKVQSWYDMGSRGREDQMALGGCRHARRMLSTSSSQNVFGLASAPPAWCSAKGRVWLCPSSLGSQPLWVVTVPCISDRPDRTGVSTLLGIHKHSCLSE